MGEGFPLFLRKKTEPKVDPKSGSPKWVPPNAYPGWGGPNPSLRPKENLWGGIEIQTKSISCGFVWNPCVGAGIIGRYNLKVTPDNRIAPIVDGRTVSPP